MNDNDFLKRFGVQGESNLGTDLHDLATRYNRLSPPVQNKLKKLSPAMEKHILALEKWSASNESDENFMQVIITMRGVCRRFNKSYKKGNEQLMKFWMLLNYNGDVTEDMV